MGTEEEHDEWVNEIETYFAEASLAYSAFVHVNDKFPQNAHDVAESLVIENISLEVLKKMLKNVTTAPLLSKVISGTALAKLILYAQGEFGKPKMSKSTKDQSQMK